MPRHSPGVAILQNTPEYPPAVQNALENDPDIGKYALPDGLAEFRAAVAAKHQRITGLTRPMLTEM